VKAFLPDQIRISQVHLRTANLERVLAFYSDVLGLKALHARGPRAVLSAAAEGPGLIVFSEEQDAPQSLPRSTGLYHFALRYPGRQALAQAYQRVLRSGYPVEGASDHGVSEAIYLSDPEGNGVELYADRPRAQWSWRNGQVSMLTRPLNLDALLALVADESTNAEPPPQTDIGHIHLHVADLASAERFYGEFLGFSVTQRSYAGALFFAAGGYHHHIGVNVWAGKAAPPAGSVGLISYRLEVPVAEILYCLSHRAPLLGFETRTESEGDGPPILQIRDPNGAWLEIQPAPTATAFEPGSVCCAGHEAARISAPSQGKHPHSKLK
jgi:catechol 2,3-dioxygenase